MGKVYFVFGIHNHQPVGNFEHIFKQAFDNCYLPFINILDKYPNIKCNVHMSGPLYDWILSENKNFIDKLRNMALRGQIEIVSGGYYEPILPIISDKDKLSQIELMNKFIKKTFKQIPQGIWLTERVWEPPLAEIINKAGLSYTFLDDTHFRYAGMNEEEFFGYYTTEESLKPIFVFPISKQLRYKIPFSQAHEAIGLLKSFAKEEDVLITLFDDGEKFGMWPHTYDWVYNKGWLDNFFRLLTEAGNVIETLTAGEAVAKFKSKGLIYLPTASYEEMGEWVLSPESFINYQRLKECVERNENLRPAKDFIRGGFFRNFYSKYQRLNYMHKRMLFISHKINSAKLSKDSMAFDCLYKAQCNCGYWHGIFGGFYLGHIRAAIYENLIKAEKELDKGKFKGSLSCERVDFDLDGYQETIIKNSFFVAVLSDKGGAFLELSLRDKSFNIVNTITRQQESYHAKIKDNIGEDAGKIKTIHDSIGVKEKNLDKYLVYDSYEKLCLVDHILSRGITIDNFIHGRNFKTLGNDSYQLNIKENKTGIVLDYNYNKDLQFAKRISFSLGSCFDAKYNFKNISVFKKYDFGTEFNLSLQSPEHVTFIAGGKRLKLSKSLVIDRAKDLTIKDDFKKICFNFKVTESTIFVAPVYSVSSSEGGFEKVYQQVAILFINRGKKDSFNINCGISQIK